MKQSTKITFLTSLGAGFEYYDFVIYSLLASFISQQYFPSSNYIASLFATFGVFAISNVVRPLGGIIFGVFGDRFGRKKIFTNTLLWMAFATLLMGLTPSFATIGVAATIIFSICRLIQGAACGAEIPGAVTFLSEHIDSKSHGLHFGFMIAAISLGASLGSFVIWIVTKLLTNTHMVAWGFRLPFLFGSLLALVAFFIRKHLPETPAFIAQKQTHSKRNLIFSRKYIGRIFNTIGIIIFPACFIIFFLVLPVYLRDIYHYSFSNVFLAITFGYLWCATLLPIFGWLSDRIGRKKLLFTTLLVFILFSIPVFSLLQLGTRWALFSFIAFNQAIIGAMSACYFVLLPQAFPTEIRYTSTAISYNITYVIAASIPLIITYIYGVIKQPHYLVWLFILLAMITAINTLLFKKEE